ncbi:MAG: hypothetical protein M5R36_06940 [Deltaproteobacteria bacterium]|nr:hypothetical protein [Deltaproteobacteria bacterium]
MVLGRRKFLSLTAQGAAALGALGFGYAMYARREKRALIDDSRPWDMSPDERFPVFDGNKQGPDRRPNIVLIVSDCWRADHFTPAITPKLWRLAERGRRYERFSRTRVSRARRWRRICRGGCRCSIPATPRTTRSAFVICRRPASCVSDGSAN